MDLATARKLKRGDRVLMHDGSVGGVVIRKHKLGVSIRWDDRPLSNLETISAKVACIILK